MQESSGGNDYFALYSLVLSVVGIIVTILLVREGREFLNKTFKMTKKIMIDIWVQFFYQALVLLIFGLALLVSFVKLGYVTAYLALSLTILLVIIFLMLTSLYFNFRKLIAKTNLELMEMSVAVNRLTEIEEVELNMIKEKWGDFLKEVSVNISFTAIHNILVMSEPFAVNGVNIIVVVPNILEPSIRSLEGRLRDIEPILNVVYGKSYKIVVHALKDTK